MAGQQSLHHIFRHELTLIARIVRRLHMPDVLMEVAKHEGYKDLLEALQLTPEAQDGDDERRGFENKR